MVDDHIQFGMETSTSMPRLTIILGMVLVVVIVVTATILFLVGYCMWNKLQSRRSHEQENEQAQEQQQRVLDGTIYEHESTSNDVKIIIKLDTMPPCQRVLPPLVYMPGDVVPRFLALPLADKTLIDPL